MRHRYQTKELKRTFMGRERIALGQKYARPQCVTNVEGISF